MPTAGPQPRRLHPRAILTLAFVATAIAYAATLTGWFVGDDFWFLASAHNQPFSDYARTAFDPRDIGSLYELDRYRPLYPVLWRLQYQLFGMHAAWYHASVLAAHLACAALVWAIARRLLPSTQAGVAALVFALHPVYADAIAWISGANRVYAALPFFAAILFFMKAQDRNATAASRRAPLAAALLLYVVAVLLHPSTIVFPGVAALYLIIFEPRRRVRSIEPWLRLLPFAAVAAAAIGVQWYVRDRLPAGEAYEFGFQQYSNYGWFIGASIVPLDNYGPFGGHPDEVRALQLAASFAVVVGITALIASGRMSRAGLFAIGWFILTLLPDSTFVLTRFGRALYLAGPAVAIVLVVAGQQILAIAPPLRRALHARTWAPPVALASLAIILAAACYARTRTLIDDGQQGERFARALRDASLNLDHGDRLLIVDPPRRLTTLGPTYVDSIAQIYFPGAIVTIARGADYDVPPGATVFIYRP